MDPRQTLIDILESIGGRDVKSAHEALDNLATWFAKGGFVPIDSIEKAVDAIRFD